MSKIKKRKDDKGRVLLKGGKPNRKSDKMYIYTYTDPYGKDGMYIRKIWFC